jgi:dimethylargininase
MPSDESITRKFSRAIVRVPGASFVEGLTTANLGTPDHTRALAQHAAYCEALEACGLSLTRLGTAERYPDSTFVEDTAVMIAVVSHRVAREPGRALPDSRATAPKFSADSESAALDLSAASDSSDSSKAISTTAILTRPGAASRAGEVESIAEVLHRHFPSQQLHSIQKPGTLDGGDVCEAECEKEPGGKSHFFIGVSQRTNEAGARALAELVAAYGCTSSFVDIRGVKGILHLKSGLAYLGDNRLVVTDSLANHEAFRGYDLVRVNAREEYAANCVRVNDHVLVAAGHPVFEQTLQDLGYKTIALEMSEFQKLDGGLSCLSLRF